MDKELFSKLSEITDEEKTILRERSGIDKTIYMSDTDGIIDSGKLLEEGKLITYRPHTRFVHFPEHGHNYIEVVYMCSGSTHHVIDGNDIYLSEGELLFLSKKARQEIYPAGENDIAVNFIILPEFFSESIKMLGNDPSPLHDFVIDSLVGAGDGPSYLHFKVSDILPIQNLIENLIWSLEKHEPNMRNINRITMGVLFLQLLNNTERVVFQNSDKDHKLMMSVLGYIEDNYANGELKDLASLLHYDTFWLSKEIKRISTHTYSELVMSKRLDQACFLLRNTRMNIIDISMKVGYENVSYFHRIFTKRYGMSPRQYRISR